MEETRLAVLIDFENIAAGTEKEGLGRFDVEVLMNRVKDKGRILVAKSYGDWGRFARFKQSLLAANVTMMELTSHGMQDKNRADIAMVVDALELAYTKPYIDTFVLVSGDSDFTPAVLKMRELDKRVIGVGTRGSTSRLLIQACDEFIFYDSLVRRPAPEVRAPSGAPQRFTILLEALAGMQRENPEPALASVVKTSILRKYPDFSESDLGFGSFARFLEAAQEAGVVRVFRDQKSGGYRVDLPENRGEARTAEPRAAAPAEAPAPAPTGAWVDTYLPAGTEGIVAALKAAGLGPVSAPVRMGLLEALVALVDERKRKRRRIDGVTAVDELLKRLRRTLPDMPRQLIQDQISVLLAAGQLLHKDGTPIRKEGAQFTLTRTAEGLNKAIVEQYLHALAAAATAMPDNSVLAGFLFGDPTRTRDVEEARAWIAAAALAEDEESLLLVAEDGPAAAPADLDDLDALLEVGGGTSFDDMLVFEDPPAAAPAPAPAPAPEPEATADAGDAKKRRRRKPKRGDAPSPAAEPEAAAPEAPPALDDGDALLDALLVED